MPLPVSAQSRTIRSVRPIRRGRPLRRAAGESDAGADAGWDRSPRSRPPRYTERTESSPCVSSGILRWTLIHGTVRGEAREGSGESGAATRVVPFLRSHLRRTQHPSAPMIATVSDEQFPPPSHAGQFLARQWTALNISHPICRGHGLLANGIHDRAATTNRCGLEDGRHVRSPAPCQQTGPPLRQARGPCGPRACKVSGLHGEHPDHDLRGGESTGPFDDRTPPPAGAAQSRALIEGSRGLGHVPPVQPSIAKVLPRAGSAWCPKDVGAGAAALGFRDHMAGSQGRDRVAQPGFRD
jgi:hypothetical protein